MPFQIIRNDITKVRADAIVNTANPKPRYAGGTDAAVYRAAGEEELLAARKKIGRIAPGEAAVTAAFRLPAKYIIHTVGPEWIDGNHGEFEILRSCYRKSLLLADQLGCKSIAFPLIATGIYGFPKDAALETALSVIREHLEESELEVTLVVFGRSSYRIAAKLQEQITEYIDENYVEMQTAAEYGSFAERIGKWRRRRRESRDAVSPADSCVPGSITPDNTGSGNAAPINAESIDEECSLFPGRPENAAATKSDTTFSAAPRRTTLEEAVKHLGESFQQRLFRMIDERGMTDPEVYKRANLDRKLFSKIRCSEDYVPKKKTIVALAIALRLNLDDTRDLLASAGLLLTNNSRSDVIVSFCIENGIYDIYEVNALLFQFDEPILG